MIATDFPGSNVSVKRPVNMTEEECSDVRAWHGAGEDGYVYFMTAWRPNADDLKTINEGGYIYCRMMLGQLVPHELFTVNENGESNSV